MAQPDWKRARTIFIAGNPGYIFGAKSDYCYTDIAKMFGVSASAVARRAKREGWLEERERYRQSIQRGYLKKLKRKMIRGELDG